MPEKALKCVITGGTGFLGREIVREFLAQGARVAVNYRREERFRELRTLVAESGEVVGFPASLDSEKDVRSFFSRVQEQFGGIDVLVQVAGGFWMGGEIAETSLEQWGRMMQMNLLTTFFCTREAFRLMKENGGGKIFTVSSRIAEELPANMGAYGVSKAAVLALSQVLAKEGAPYNIQVNTVMPGIIDTPANRQMMPEADFSQWVSPSEIARLLYRLCEPGAPVLSHSVLKMYGRL